MRRATRDDVPALAGVLARAFDDDPCQVVAFYRRDGFQVRAEHSIPGGPTVWSMWRDPVRR